MLWVAVNSLLSLVSRMTHSEWDHLLDHPLLFSEKFLATNVLLTVTYSSKLMTFSLRLWRASLNWQNIKSQAADVKRLLIYLLVCLLVRLLVRLLTRLPICDTADFGVSSGSNFEFQCELVGRNSEFQSQKEPQRHDLEIEFHREFSPLQTGIIS